MPTQHISIFLPLVICLATTFATLMIHGFAVQTNVYLHRRELGLGRGGVYCLDRRSHCSWHYAHRAGSTIDRNNDLGAGLHFMRPIFSALGLPFIIPQRTTRHWGRF